MTPSASHGGAPRAVTHRSLSRRPPRAPPGSGTGRGTEGQRPGGVGGRGARGDRVRGRGVGGRVQDAPQPVPQRALGVGIAEPAQEELVHLHLQARPQRPPGRHGGGGRTDGRTHGPGGRQGRGGTGRTDARTDARAPRSLTVWARDDGVTGRDQNKAEAPTLSKANSGGRVVTTSQTRRPPTANAPVLRGCGFGRWWRSRT